VDGGATGVHCKVEIKISQTIHNKGTRDRLHSISELKSDSDSSSAGFCFPFPLACLFLRGLTGADRHMCNPSLKAANHSAGVIL
jgi:hypothetical protein